MIYTLLRVIARLALRWYYRSVEIDGTDHVPARGPVLLVANHWNALVDALVVACALDRQVRLTAKATLLANPFTRCVVRIVGIIPLRRASDEQRPVEASLDKTRNATSFAAILDAFADQQAVLIFPEGRSHSEPELGRLKTGAARLALMAQVERALPPVPIVPVGITFEDKGRPRSRVVVRFGPTITPPAATEVMTADVQALTAHLDRGIRELTLNFPSSDEALRVVELAAILSRVLDRVRPLTAPDPPLADAVRLAQRLESARRVLPTASPSLAHEVDAFLHRVHTFRDRLRALEIPVNDLWMPVTTLSGTWFVLREVSIALLALPVALWGRLNHWLPLTLARWVGRATSRNADEPAMRTIVSGLVFVLLFYLALATSVWWRFGPLWGLVYLIALPPSASLDFWLTERLRRGRERARAYRTLRRDPGLRAALRQEASDIRATARRLDTVVR